MEHKLVTQKVRLWNGWLNLFKGEEIKKRVKERENAGKDERGVSSGKEGGK